MSCLENIVSIRKTCDSSNVVSLSGYDVMDAPELSALTLADIASSKYVSGLKAATSALSRAILDIRNDFLGVLSGNKVIPNIVNRKYPTSEFLPLSPVSPSNLERGITIFRNPKIMGQLRKLKIGKVHIYPLINVASTNILVYDNGIKTSYNVQLVANQVNTFDIDYKVKGDFARVLLDNSSISLASAKLICHIGCNGAMPNDCGYTKGYNGTNDTEIKEGYGIGLEFYCDCDYEQVLCDLSKAYVGKLLFLKTRLFLLDERLYGDRNNPWTIYGKEEAKEIKREVDTEYTQQWNTFVESLGNVLLTYRDDCLSCKGNNWKTNI